MFKDVIEFIQGVYKTTGVIPLHEPKFIGNEKKYLNKCIDSTFVSTVGRFVDQFENDIAKYTGAKYAVSCVNGTSALQLSLRLAGVRPGDEVIVPTLTFIAPVNAIAYNGAEPVFMDANEYFNIDSEKTIEFIKQETVFKDGFTINKATNKRITAIIPVHVWGNACWLDDLLPLCGERNIIVVEEGSIPFGIGAEILSSIVEAIGAANIYDEKMREALQSWTEADSVLEIQDMILQQTINDETGNWQISVLMTSDTHLFSCSVLGEGENISGSAAL